MPVELRYISDPACPRSWAAEPARRVLEWELGDSLDVVEVMGGLGRELDVAWTDSESGAVAGRDTPAALAADWMEVAGRSGMPVDPRLWTSSPLRSTYPVSMAVKAASEQGRDAAARYLRRAREAILCGRRRLDHAEPLVALAAEADLDADRFSVDVESHAILELLGSDLDEARDVTDEARAAGAVAMTAGRERLPFPTAVFVGDRGERHAVYGPSPAERLIDAARAAGAEAVRDRRPSAVEAVERFGSLATREVVELTGSPAPVVLAELWAAAREWRLRPAAVLTGWLWRPAGEGPLRPS